MDWAKTIARRDNRHLTFGFGASYIRNFTVCIIDPVFLNISNSCTERLEPYCPLPLKFVFCLPACSQVWRVWEFQSSWQHWPAIVHLTAVGVLSWAGHTSSWHAPWQGLPAQPAWSLSSITVPAFIRINQNSLTAYAIHLPFLQESRMKILEGPRWFGLQGQFNPIQLKQDHVGTWNTTWSPHIHFKSSHRQAAISRILNQNSQNDLEGQGQWPSFSIPAEGIQWCMFGVNLVISAQIMHLCDELLCGLDKVHERRTDGGTDRRTQATSYDNTIGLEGHVVKKFIFTQYL